MAVPRAILATGPLDAARARARICHRRAGVRRRLTDRIAWFDSYHQAAPQGRGCARDRRAERRSGEARQIGTSLERNGTSTTELRCRCVSGRRCRSLPRPDLPLSRVPPTRALSGEALRCRPTSSGRSRRRMSRRDADRGTSRRGPACDRGADAGARGRGTIAPWTASSVGPPRCRFGLSTLAGWPTDVEADGRSMQPHER